MQAAFFSKLLKMVYADKETNILSTKSDLYNNQINACALIGQSAKGYCAGKPTEKSRVFWIII